MEVGRYHSLIAKPETLPAELIVTARTPEGEIMGVRHRDLPVEGVQFHPESVLTPDGPLLMGNFLQFTGGRQRSLRHDGSTCAKRSNDCSTARTWRKRRRLRC